ncbi:hypothetical protein HanPSC8_Chr09g0379151 [Helianthus annuus]|nr:hypothetical protein HanPSC8_Chr09g0379151 [Helianthus annuus]
MIFKEVAPLETDDAPVSDKGCTTTPATDNPTSNYKSHMHSPITCANCPRTGGDQNLFRMEPGSPPRHIFLSSQKVIRLPVGESKEWQLHKCKKI